MTDLETWLERVYAAGGDRATLDAAGAWTLLDRSRLFRTYPFSAQEAHLRHWVLAYRKA